MKKITLELQKNQILNYSKVKLNEMMVKLEYKVTELKKEIKILLNRATEEFKSVFGALNKELKYEVKQLILKVQEFFKLKENIQKLKEELGKNWVLNYTKIRLIKAVKIMDYKIKELKSDIKFRMEKIKIKINEFVEKKLNIKLNLKEKVRKISDKLKLDEKVKALRKLKEIILLLLLFKIFKNK